MFPDQNFVCNNLVSIIIIRALLFKYIYFLFLNDLKPLVIRIMFKNFHLCLRITIKCNLWQAMKFDREMLTKPEMVTWWQIWPFVMWTDSLCMFVHKLHSTFSVECLDSYEWWWIFLKNAKLVQMSANSDGISFWEPLI
jgi:hypothetical protein